MNRRIALLLIVLAAPLSASAGYETFPELLAAMLAVQERGAEGVENYAMDVTLMNQTSTTYHERTEIDLAEGRKLQTFRLVPFDEVQRRRQDEAGMSPDGMQAYADGLRMTGDAIGDEMDRGMADSGLPPGLLRAVGPDPTGTDPDAEPWANPDPRVMLHGMAGFADAAANGGPPNGGAPEVTTGAEPMVAFAQKAEIVGRETIDDRETYRVRADDLDLTETIDDGEFVIRSMQLWVDTERLVPLKMRMDGVAVQDGQTREIFIERLDRDYRTVPGSAMVMPYRSVLRMGGVLSPKEQKQLEETRVQLADFDAQMAAMEPSQRTMIENSMGAQIEVMRKMVEGGAFEIETVVREIRVNEGIEGAFRPVASAPGSGGDDLVTMIQRDLTALGYEPGDVDGELSTATAVAISKFQAERDLDVTGEPSPQLAGILAAEVAGRGTAADAAPSAGARDAADLQRAREACLNRKIAEAHAAQKKKKRFGKFLGAVGRTVGRHGGGDLASDVARVSSDIYDANATAEDLAEAAEALGITQDDIAACEHPG